MIGFCISEDVEQNGESGSQPGAEQQFKETSFNWFLNFLSPGRDCWCPTKPFFFLVLTHLSHIAGEGTGLPSLSLLQSLWFL